MKPREALLLSIVLSVIIYIGISFAFTGKIFSSIDSIVNSITHQKYNIHFCVNDKGFIILPDVGITDVRVTPLSLGELDIFQNIRCNWFGFKGYAIVEVRKVNGDIIYKTNINDIHVCEGDKVCFDRSFSVDGSDNYKITIRLFNEKSEQIDTWSTESYLVDKNE